MRFEQQIRIPAAREAVWELLADTERLNREMGLPPIHFEFRPREGGGSEVLATLRLGRLEVRYREHPFEWVRPERYSIRRTFFGGPIVEIWGEVRLEEEDGATRVTCVAEVQPNGATGLPVAYAAGRKAVADFMTACRGFSGYLAGKAATPYPRHAGRSPAMHSRLVSAQTRLAAAEEADPRASRRLAEFLESAPPEDVIQIRPFALADRWGLDRFDVLRTCLLGARVGMLDLRWRVLCPSCRGARDSTSSLNEVGRAVHCAACNLKFDAEFDRSVEVCFAAPPAIRAVQEQTYCVGGPALTPHILAQWLLAPGEERETALALPPGAHALTGPRIARPLPLDAGGEGGVLEVAGGTVGVQVLGWLGEEGEQGRRGEGESRQRPDDTLSGSPSPHLPCSPSSPGRSTARVRLRLHNRTPETVLLRLESREWSSVVATAAQVTSLQAFRDQFSSEVLAPGTELAVRQVCILFSDLKGSTAMYRRFGDAPSYRAVRDHFDFLRRHVAAHHGAIVKTIGDAIMASFTDPADGLAAALAIQQEAPRELGELTVKLGMHWGPAIVVNANGTLDYFGQTVNLAARLQGESIGGDVVLSEALAADAQAEGLLAGGAARVERFVTTVRGLDEAIPMIRVWPCA